MLPAEWTCGLARSIRNGAEARRLPDDLLAVIAGMGLKKPRASAAAIHQHISTMAKAQGWAIHLTARFMQSLLTLTRHGDFGA